MLRKKIWETPAGFAAVMTFLSGVVIHLYGLIIAPHNYDDIFAAPFGYGSGIVSGRFTLTWLGETVKFLLGGYSLPVVNGLLFVLFLSLAVWFLVSVLSIRRRAYAGMIGMLFAAFPTAASTLIHRFTAPYYGIGVLLSIIAAWILYRNKFGLLLSAVCTALALGIYQAFVPITITIYVLLLLQQALEGKSTVWSMIKRGLYDCFSIILGVALYFLILNITLKVTGLTLLDYQGIDRMGHIALRDIPGLVLNAIYLACMLPFHNYCGLTCTPLLKLCYLGLYAVTAILVCYILLVKIRRIDIALFTIFLCGVFPLAVNFVYVMCPDGNVYTLMVYSFALIACLPIVALQCLPPLAAPDGRQKTASRCVGLLLAVLISVYAYMDNVNYSALYYCNRQVENYLTAFVAQVRMTDGFSTDKKWAIIGEFSDPLFWFDWDSGITFGGFSNPQDHINSHARHGWITNYLGYGPTMVEADQLEALAQIPQVRQMPCWPNAGSIQIIEDTIVIKCQEIAP